MAQIAGEPDEPPKRLAWLVDVFPESSERSRVAQIPEMQRAATDDWPHAPEPVAPTVAAEVGATIRDAAHPRPPSGMHMLSIWRIASIAANCAFVLRRSPAVPATRSAPSRSTRPTSRTVYVPMIESDSYRRDLGERLTEAVIKEIELKTPYKVVGTPDADSILSAKLLERYAAHAGRKRVRRSAGLGDRVAGRSDVAQSPPAADRADAERSRCRRSCCAISQTSNLIPEVGQSVATSQQQAIERLAQQIVSTMEAPW